MGYDSYAGATRSGLIAEITRNQHDTARGLIHKTLAHSAVGNTLWCLHQVVRVTNATPLFNETEIVDTYIGCYLLCKQGGDWAYKGMDERVGPYYYTCPLKYLDQAPETNAEWRAKVRQYHAGRKAQRDLEAALQVGDTVALVNTSNPKVVRISQIAPHILGYGEDHRLYRIPVTKLGCIIEHGPTGPYASAFPS